MNDVQSGAVNTCGLGFSIFPQDNVGISGDLRGSVSQSRKIIRSFIIAVLTSPHLHYPVFFFFLDFCQFTGNIYCLFQELRI